MMKSDPAQHPADEFRRRRVEPEINPRDHGTVIGAWALGDDCAAGTHRIERRTDTEDANSVFADSRGGRNSASHDARPRLAADGGRVGGANLLDSAAGN